MREDEQGQRRPVDARNNSTFGAIVLMSIATTLTVLILDEDHPLFRASFAALFTGYLLSAIYALRKDRNHLFFTIGASFSLGSLIVLVLSLR